MKDRLIEIIKQCACHYSPPCDGDCGLCNNVEMYDDQIEHIADAIIESDIIKRCHKQSENVIELPCKVGDVAYVIYRGVVTQGTVRLIRPFVSEQEIIFKGNFICEVDNLFIDDGTKEEVELYVVFEKPYGIERVAYLNREEAEKELAKMKGGE